jgi:hypothetical protein
MFEVELGGDVEPGCGFEFVLEFFGRWVPVLRLEPTIWMLAPCSRWNWEGTWSLVADSGLC